MSDHELWNEVGNVYFMSGSYKRAIHAYHRALDLDPDSGEPQVNLALTCAQMGRHGEAIEHYRRGIGLLSDAQEKAMSLHKLGDLHFHLKEYSLAMEAYQQADTLIADSQFGMDGLEPADLLLQCKPKAIVEMEIGTLPTASPPGMVLLPFIEELTPWWYDGQTAPEDPPPYDSWLEDEMSITDLGESVVFTEALTWEVATAYQESAVMTDASIDVTGRDTFARETINQGHLEALEVTMNALAAVESVPAASQSKKKKRNGSHADTATGQHETAEVVVITDEPETVTITPGFSTATTTSPEVVHYESTPDLPTVELSPDERARIEAEIGRIFQSLDKNPYDAAAWDSLGNQYKALGQFDDAIGAYQEAVTLDQSNAGYHHDLGLVYAAVGKPDEAIASFEIVIEIEPDHSLAHATLGGYYRRNGKEELAKAHIEKARRLIEKEENPYNLACLEAIDSNIDRSLQLLEIALKNKREYVNWARTDHDLDFIRTDPRFLALLTKYSTQTGK